MSGPFAFLLLAVASSVFPSSASPDPPSAPSPRPPALAEIDRRIREEFWDPNLKGVDWNGAVERAAAELASAAGQPERDAAYDRLLARLDDSHTFRIPAGKLPEARWATAGLRIGRDGAGYAVKAVLPGGAAERAGLRLGDRILSIGGREYGLPRVDFRALFLALEGPLRSTVEVAWETAAGERRTAALALEPEPPGDTLFWRSARVLRRGGHAWGYARLWGISPEVALALVDLLSDRTESAAAKPELAGLADIDGLLLDVRGNSGGYDPGILSTFLRGRWSAGDYRVRSRGRVRVVPPEYRPLPIALLVNSGTASSGEALALKFRRHAIGPIVGEETAGMLSGGAAVAKLADGSTLWFSARAIEDADGRSYEGRGVRPDVLVPDRPAKAAGQEDAVVEAAIQALAARARK
ncbi:MAG: PDZ domain-containing protein [Acidobacteria bacterium]|nr:PDZ domain-containing protein [Acidobacteriota bacterium]